MNDSSIQELQASFRECVGLITESNPTLANDILTRVVIPTLDKFQKKISVGLQDSISDLLDQFKKEIETEIFDVAQNWSLRNKQEKLLFPRNCRFAYTKGKSTVLIIEQDPIQRALTLDTRLVGRRGEVTSGNSTSGHSTVRLPLQLPYVLFAFRWSNGLFQKCYTAWTKNSIQKLSDPIYDPLLPNIHHNYEICFGSMFQNRVFPSIGEGCHEIISAFWQSTFNLDLDGFWWSKRNIPAIADATTWSESQDPFLFNNIDLPKQIGSTVESLVDLCLHKENDPDSLDLKKQLTKSIEACSDHMFTKLLKYFKKKKFDRFYPKEVESELTVAIESIIQELRNVVLVMNDQLETVSQQTHFSRKDVDHYGWEAVNKEFWNPYGG